MQKRPLFILITSISKSPVRPWIFISGLVLYIWPTTDSSSSSPSHTRLPEDPLYNTLLPFISSQCSFLTKKLNFKFCTSSSSLHPLPQLSPLPQMDKSYHCTLNLISLTPTLQASPLFKNMHVCARLLTHMPIKYTANISYCYFFSFLCSLITWYWNSPASNT